MSSLTSASLNACSRSRLWSEITPVPRFPISRGTKTDDRDGSPAIASGLPASMHRRSMSSLTTTGSRVSSAIFRNPMISIGWSISRTPRSIEYGNQI